MEDNSYVSLSLQKYNELYDKAKKFDELTKQFGDKLSDTINTIIDGVNSMFTNDEEETEQEELKIGDRVVAIGTITTKDATDIPYNVYFNERASVWFTKDEIKKYKEEK